MAVIQISKIQVRRGLQEHLPQLASAELGWSIDERRLFIGNGELSEGAPSVGNTEILTQYSDILNVVETYYFIGDESGYTSQTAGPSAVSPITRTLQHKLDERVSVRDFGAVGDGSTDDTDAIQRALDEVYPTSEYSSTEDNVAVRRNLYFPAGIYIISDELSIPIYAKLTGDGIDATIIKQTSASPRSLLTFRDSSEQVNPYVGDGGADFPSYVDITSMTLQNNTDNDVVLLDSAFSITFSKVKFKGSQTSPLTAGTSKALVKLISEASASYNISFDRCIFTNASYGILASGNIYGVSVIDSRFYTLFQAIKTYTDGTSSPKSLKVTNSIFDQIANTAVTSSDVSSMSSAFNYYKSVGFGNASVIVSAVPTAPVVYYENPNNYSIGDLFERTEVEATVFPRIKTTGTFGANASSLNASGSLKYTPGATDIISASSTLANTSLTLYSVNTTNAFVDYSITRGSNVRSGTMRVALTSTGSCYFEDDYIEYPASTQYSYGVNSSTGTELVFNTFGSNVILQANTSASGGNVTLKYNVRRFS